jgi:hypothetical protein
MEVIAVFVAEAAYDSKILAMKNRYPDAAQAIDWAKIHLKKQDRVVWYLNLLDQFLATNDNKLFAGKSLEDFQETLLHYIGQTNLGNIQNYQFAKQTADQVFRDLAAIEQKHQEKQQQTQRPAGRFNARQGDKVLLEFPDGSRWVQLNAAYCDREADSGRHCGNVEGQHKKDQRILSYRDKDNRVVLTFILEPDGTLGEMKGVANAKPAERYHPVIMKLLLQPWVKGISGGGYLADSNFSVLDLSEQNLQVIEKQKPQLISTQLAVTPFEILNAPAWIKNNQNYVAVATRKHHAIGILIQNPSVRNWDDAIDRDEDLIVYAPDELTNYRSRLLEYLIQEEDPELLLRCRNRYRKDFNFLKDLLTEAGEYLQAIPPTTRGYDHLCKIAVSNNVAALRHVPRDLRTPELCKIAVSNYGRALYDVPEELRTVELCKIAVSNDGRALEFVPRDLQPELSKIAVRNHDLALYYVPKELRTLELCKLAVSKDGRALEYVPQELRTLKLCKIAVSNNSKALAFVPRDLRTLELCKIAVSKDRRALAFVPEELRDEVIKNL